MNVLETMINNLRKAEVSDEQIRIAFQNQPLSVIGQTPKQKGKKKRKNGNRDHQRKVVIDYLKNNESVSCEKTAELLDLSPVTCHKILHGLESEGIVTVTDRNEVPYFYRLATPIDEEYSTRSDQVLQYVSDHIGEQYSLAEMAAEIGIPRGTIYTTVYILEKKKLLPKGFNLGPNEHRVKVKESEVVEVETVEVEPVEEQTVVVEERKTLIANYLDNVAWQYIRQMRLNNVGTISITEIERFIDYVRETENL